MGSSSKARSSAISISDEDRRVDPHLGYPRAYAKLCRNACAWMQLQGFLLPFSDGPPKSFLPYAPRPEDIAKMEQVQDLFPIIIKDAKADHSPQLEKFRDVLWQQLDHLGNAGFDPACFRVDAYGNVLYWHADPSSPLAWEVCHWFPYSRGGKTVLNNLRVVHWQVSEKKKEKLEFLIPWWELQLGVSITQFLSAFDSPKVGFRQRSLAYLFLGGEDETPDGKICISDHQWTHHFVEKRKSSGLAVAGLVRLNKGEESRSTPAFLTGSQQEGWTLAEEEALLRGYQKFGFGNWKAIKESENCLANRSLVQIRDKYRAVVGLEKENVHAPLHQKSPSNNENSEYVGHPQIDRLLSSLKRESKIKLLRDEEKQMRGEEYSKLEQTLQSVKSQNQQEKNALDSLEAELRKQRRQLEKQRQWNETQTSYRICLERMIQETMHQCVVFKEESRLNEMACNSLMAQLESQAATCTAAESRLIHQSSKRQDLLQMAAPVPLLEFGASAMKNPEDHPPEPPGESVQASPEQPAKPEVSNLSDKKPRTRPSTSKEERQVLQARDLQNHPAPTQLKLNNPASSKQQQELSLSDSEDHHRKHKRVRKSGTTPAKRSQSAPRQRIDKENIGGAQEFPPSSAKLDKLYYEVSRSSRLASKVGESRRTAGHGVRSLVNTSQSENEKVENLKALSTIPSPLREVSENNLATSSNNNNVVQQGESDGEKSASTRTFKLMPVLKRGTDGHGQQLESGYGSCGSQRFRGILQSRDSSERFELDVSEIEPRKVSCSEVRGGRRTTEAQASNSCDEESLREGKSTLDKWLQMLLVSTEPTQDEPESSKGDEIKPVEATPAPAPAPAPKPEQDSTTRRLGRGWPEDIAVPPPGLNRGYSLRVQEERSHTQSNQTQSRKSSSDKLKVPFTGLLRRLSLRQQHGSSSSKGGAGVEADVREPPRRQVTFEDWEGITNKLAAMNLDSSSSNQEPIKPATKENSTNNNNNKDFRKLRSTSLRASTGSLASLRSGNSSQASPPVISVNPSPPPVLSQARRGGKSLLYYSSVDNNGAGNPSCSRRNSSCGVKVNQAEKIKAMSRRASIDQCAQAWKKQVNRLESQQN